MPRKLTTEEMRDYQRRRRAEKTQAENEAGIVEIPDNGDVGSQRHRRGEPVEHWWEREPPLGKFMLDHMTTAEVDALLDRMDTHKHHGKGEKSRA